MGGNASKQPPTLMITPSPAPMLAQSPSAAPTPAAAPAAPPATNSPAPASGWLCQQCAQQTATVSHFAGDMDSDDRMRKMFMLILLAVAIYFGYKHLIKKRK